MPAVVLHRDDLIANADWPASIWQRPRPMQP